MPNTTTAWSLRPGSKISFDSWAALVTHRHPELSSADWTHRVHVGRVDMSTDRTISTGTPDTARIPSIAADKLQNRQPPLSEQGHLVSERHSEA